jgi:mono/diheme cytochrome c family protein
MPESKTTFAAFVAFSAFTATASFAAAKDVVAEPTFYRDVLPVLQENCQDCHRPSGSKIYRGGVPMSLTTYDEVRPWAKAIVRQTASKEMPPWDASEAFDGVFHNERGLTDTEIATLARWVESGSPVGDSGHAPEPRVWPENDEGWVMLDPDLVLDMPEPYFVADDVEDVYTKHRLVLAEDIFPEDRWVQAIEFRRGSEVVHHFNIFAKGSGEEDGSLDGVRLGDGNYVGGATSGSPPHVWPEGYGTLLESGSTLTFDVHYHKEPGPGTGVWDRSSIALKFATKPVEHPIHFYPVSNYSFEIPPGHPYWHDSAEHVFERDITLLGMLPHMHMRGREARYTVEYPDGEREEILHVPGYDFDWQEIYWYSTPKTLPAGSMLRIDMWFDNSPEEAERWGFDADRTVTFGPESTDEMLMGFISFVYDDEEVAPDDHGGVATADVGSE